MASCGARTAEVLAASVAASVTLLSCEHKSHGLDHALHATHGTTEHAATHAVWSTLRMLVVTVLSRTADAKLAVNLRVQIDALGSLRACWEVLALLSRVHERAVSVVAVGEEAAANLLLASRCAALVLIVLLDGSLQVYLLGAAGLLLICQRIRLESGSSLLPLRVRGAVLAERSVRLMLLLMWPRHPVL